MCLFVRYVFVGWKSVGEVRLFLKLHCCCCQVLSGPAGWMMSDGRFWGIMCWWSQMFVSEASSLVVIHQSLSELDHWWIKSDVCFWNFIIGTDITACLSQLFVTWVHWWRRVLVLWRCRKNRKPRLDFSSRCLTSSEAGLWTHQYCWVRQVNWLGSDLLAVWLLR